MISTSENIQVALKQVQSPVDDKKPTLLILYARNMYGGMFKRIGAPNYSVYDQEKEILFTCPFILILKVEEVLIDD